MICPRCKAQDHDNCADNPRKLAFNMGELRGIGDVNSGEWCYCHHAEPITAGIPVKEVIE